jgi:leucyl aminopeptidase (aminopeptidase T)
MDLQLHAKRIIEDIFALKKEESFLILSEEFDETLPINEHDKIRWRRLVNFIPQLYEAIKNYYPNTSLYFYRTTKGSGQEPWIDVWEEVFDRRFVDALKKEGLMDLILKKQIGNKLDDVINILKNSNKVKYYAMMAITNFSTTHTLFRKLLTDQLGVRYASMPFFDIDMFKTSMDVEYKKLEIITEELAKKLNNYDAFQITSNNGTDLYVPKFARLVKTDTGNLKGKGNYSNLPAGEAFLAPVEGESKGILVIELSTTRKLNSPVKVKIDKGAVVDIEGVEDFVEELQNKLNAHENNKNIAELGFGTNRNAIIVDNILEAEKIYGTVHVAFGDNAGFGGRVSAPFHEDFLILYPEVYGIRDGEKSLILKNREFVDI